MTTKPNPGSNEAVALGCRCPVIDNHYGKGVPSSEDEPYFWINEDCELHGIKGDNDDEV